MKKILLSLCITISSFSIAQQFNQISDINPGNLSSYPTNFTELNNNLIFTATSSSSFYPRDIYKSDGTTSGTSLVMAISTYLSSGNEPVFMKCGNSLYFKIMDASSGYLDKLWKTDGTLGGTVLVKDLNTKEHCSNLCEMNGMIYFMTSYFDIVWGNTIHELWKSDGTLSGTAVVKDWTNSSFGNSITIRAFNNKIYFLGNESDGTLAGTIQTGVLLPLISQSCILNGIIYYRGSDGKLWKTDGTLLGTVQAVDFPVYNNLYTSNGWIYFSGGYNGVGLPGNELCKTDGTLANTSMIKDIYLGFNSSNPNELIDINGTIFFLANDGISGKELWKTDGTAGGTTLVKDISPGLGGIYGYQSTKHDNQLYFTIYDMMSSNYGIWKSDGTELNTVLVQSFSDSIGEILEINCNLFLAADNLDIPWPDNFNSELWCDTSNCSSLDLVSLNELKQTEVYPNPTTDKITITTALDKIGYTYTILDNIGKSVYTNKVESLETVIDLQDLLPGLYFFKLENTREILKIIKQ